MGPRELAAALVEAARRAGATSADALAVESRDVSVSVRGGALEEAESAEASDYGLRVLIGRRQASVSASDPAPSVIAELAARAVAMARVAPEDEWCGLPDESGLADPSRLPDLDLDDPAPAPAPSALRELAERAEAAALGEKGVTQVESAGAGWRRAIVAYAASNGFAGSYARTGASLSVSAVAGAGLKMETDYDFAARTHAADLPAPEEIGVRAGRRAAERLNPRRAKTGAWPVLFDRRVAGSLVGHLLGAINGAAVARGASWLKDRMDEPVLAPGFDLVDDPHRRRGAGSRPFDGEGMALSPRGLIENGVLKGWTLDSATARRLGLPAPGGARRGVGGAPQPGTSNLTLSEGARSPEELIGEMGEGLIVTSLIGSSISATTGAYSRGASGFWVEDGEIAFPVNELTIAGALPEFLRRMTPANDSDRTKALITPSLLVEGLTVASG
ncbi:TldD/PmbA family protein [Pikeienuella piscinae]|uniref:TldD/PmbA family protein n=1 Tax=Pikeienuella piscinae TaxID=2748098 RepID=A0A7L5BXR2_9RHOB|nr:TldD/PmbA family protein [Pikeienuella piscinae]QIE56221.1 TldD/PmbA family protein [Pikeienuella piscinae]